MNLNFVASFFFFGVGEVAGDFDCERDRDRDRAKELDRFWFVWNDFPCWIREGRFVFRLSSADNESSSVLGDNVDRLTLRCPTTLFGTLVSVVLLLI